MGQPAVVHRPRHVRCHLWGLNPCRAPTPDGGSFYGSFGAPPDNLPFQKGTDNNGTITPTATLPSLSFAPAEVLRVARHLYDTYKDRFWLRYGFPDALNPAEPWFDREYIGIDEGPIIMGIENYRSGLFWRYFGAEPMVWEGLRRAGFAGVVDTFDEMEHSPAYGRWSAGDAGGSFQLERTSGFVKEGRRPAARPLRCGARGYAVLLLGAAGPPGFLPLRATWFWLRGSAELDPVLVMADGQLVPLAEVVSRPVAQGWRHCYYSIPSAAREAPVQELRFLLKKPGQGTCWLDAILLTHEVENREAEFVLGDLRPAPGRLGCRSGLPTHVASGGRTGRRRRAEPAGTSRTRAPTRGAPHPARLEPLPFGLPVDEGPGHHPPAVGRWSRARARRGHLHLHQRHRLGNTVLQHPGEPESRQQLGAALRQA